MVTKRLGPWVVAALACWAVILWQVRPDLALSLLQHAQRRLLVLAMALQVVAYLLLAEEFRTILGLLSIHLHRLDLVSMLLTSTYTRAAGGKRRPSRGRTSAGALLLRLAYRLSLLPILGAGLYFVAVEPAASGLHLAGLTLLGIGVAAYCQLFLLGFRRPVAVEGLLRRVRGLSLGLLSDVWVKSTSADLVQGSLAVTVRPSSFLAACAMALVWHMAEVGSLVALFAAAGEPIDPATVLTGYIVGHVLWMLDAIPQGVGLVEVSVAMTFMSFGVEPATAVTVSLIYRVLTFWLPAAVGFLVARRPRVAGLRTLAVLIGLSGALGIVSCVTPAARDRLALLRPWLPFAVRQGAYFTATLAGLSLVMLVSGLMRRKRVAWTLSALALAVSTVAHLLRGLELEQSLLCLALLCWLLAMREEFHARSDAPSALQGLLVLGVGTVGLAVYGTLGFWLLNGHFMHRYAFGAALAETFDALLTAPHGTTRFARYFAASIPWVATAVAVTSLWMLLRPVLHRAPSTPAQQQRARDLVERFGRSSLAFFALLPDKAYFFSEGGSVIAYGVRGRAAVALGDPIGPTEDLAPAVAGFQTLCRRNDWLPAFLQVPQESLDVYQTAGLSAVEVGKEAIVDVRCFGLAGRAFKSIRSEVNRIKRLGYTCQVHQPPLSSPLVAELRAVSDAWLAERRGQEKGFSLGWFYDAYVSSSQVAAVHAPDGSIVAFVNLVPEFGLPELTIDLMRRLPDTERGCMELLFVSLFEWAREHDYEAVNLGLSPLFGVGQYPEDPLLEKVIYYIYEHLNRFYSFKGLHKFKEKFRPRWSSRSLVYPPGGLPSVVRALILLGSGDDFLWKQPLDLLRQALTRRPGSS